MYPVLLLGAGKIGSAIAKLLARSGDYDVRAADMNADALRRLRDAIDVETHQADLSDAKMLAQLMKDRRAVICACPHQLNKGIARAALRAGLSYFDLTEDVDTMHTIQRLAKKAKRGQIFMPQCGLAPGFVSIATYSLTRQFDKLDQVRMRVGALPRFPTNEMKYNLTWSTDGLINEYGNPCEAIHEGKLITTQPLEGLEHFSLDGVDYEAFNTSGGAGTLAQTLKGKVRELNYKTIRYRGHRNLIAFLMSELRLNQRRELLQEILENAIPVTHQDLVLIFCTVTGRREGRLTQITDARKIYATQIAGEQWSAIELTTSAGLCAVFDLFAMHDRFDRGFIRQEQVSIDEFLGNRFGKYFARGDDEPAASRRQTMKGRK